jgi:starch-binding outer membrane protein, SusD/RagB family
MKKTYISGFIAAALVVLSSSCGESFLEQAPLGSLEPSEVIGGQKGIEGLLIGAYAVVDGTVAGETSDGWISTQSNWVFGSVAAGEAYKGSDSGDQSPINEIEVHTTSASNPFLNGRWKVLYDGVARTNQVLINLAQLPEGTVSAEDSKRIIAEAKALRGFFHFEAKKMWNNVPYLDESTDPGSVTNTVDIWPMIEADLTAAVADLPGDGMDKGRMNKWAAKALLGKVYLYQGKWDAAATALQDVYDNGTTPGGTPYALNATFRQAFNGNNDNSAESVFAAQYTGSDGSGGFNASSGEVLNFPHNGGFGAPTNCCGFYQPSHDFVNSFRTVGGLPLLDGSYNDPANEVVSDEVVFSNGAVGHIVTGSTTVNDPDGSTVNFVQDAGNLDPRLDWTVGRRGIPYLDWGTHPGSAWVRDLGNGGPFSPKKHVFNKADVGTYTDNTAWTAGFATNNYYIIRFADVILMLAEAKVERNAGSDLAEATDLVNEIRARAANSDVAGSPANYDVALYPDFADQATGRAAVRMERKLELGMEGHRFFDIARWGISANYLNDYTGYEKKWRTYFKSSSAGAEDAYYPIPTRQIQLMGADVLVQNP